MWSNIHLPTLRAHSEPVRRRRPGLLLLTVEEMEPRLAPATMVSATLVTYLDVDGDNVSVISSKPIFNAATVNNVFKFDSGGFSGSFAQRLQLLDLTATNAPTSGDSITIKASPSASGGDGLVNVGTINAQGIALANVTVNGDLGRISAAGLAILSAHSLGRFAGTLYQQPGADVQSLISGKLGALVITTDVVGAGVSVDGRIGSVTVGGSMVGGFISTSPGSNRDIGAVVIGGNIEGGDGSVSARGYSLGEIGSQGKIASLTIGGSVLGGTGPLTGVIVSAGDMGPVSIKGNVRGGSGLMSAAIVPAGKLASVSLGGSLMGGAGDGSGRITAANMGPVSIAGDIRGVSALSGFLLSTQGLASVTIGGSLIGGAGGESGRIRSQTNMGPVVIKGDIRGSTSSDSGEIASGSGIASVTVGGSLQGADGANSASIRSTSDLGPVTVTGDLRGGSGDNSGEVSAGGTLASLSIGGSLVGGTGQKSGYISSGSSMGPVNIRGDIRGGSNTFSGSIDCGSQLAALTVGGSVIGGDGTQSARVFSGSSMGKVKIAGDLRGGMGANAGVIICSNVAAVTVGGSLLRGGGGNAGAIISQANIGPVSIQLDDSGGILGGRIASVFVGGSMTVAAVEANFDIGPITVSGNLQGSLISAQGQPNPTTSDVAIASLSVGGRVEFTNVLAGYSSTIPMNGSAQIGPVKVGGDWIASNLIAGVAPGNDGLYGDINDQGATDDTLIGGGTPGILAKIASIQIGGQAIGSVDGSGSFALEAEQIGFLSVNGVSYRLTPGPHNDLVFVGDSGNLVLNEL